MNNKDNLEQLFGRVFNEEDAIAQKDGWNVPSDGVWDRIEMELPKEEKPIRRLMYWPLLATAASFLLLVSFFQLYQSKQEIGHLASKLDTQEQAVKELKKEMESFAVTVPSVPKKASAAAIVVQEAPVSLNVIKPIQADNLQYAAVKEQTNNKYQNFTNKEIIESDVPVSPLSGNLLDEGVADKNALATTANFTPFTNNIALKEQLPPFHYLPTLQNALPTNLNAVAISTNAVIEPIKNKKSVYLAASFAPISELRSKNKSAYKLTTLVPNAEKQQLAFTAGVQAGIKLGKGWAVESGLRYTKANQTGQHSRQVTYEQLEEHLNKYGEFETNVNIKMGSAAGIAETAVVLSRSAVSMVAEDTKINLNLALESSQSFLDIPVLARKQWRVGNLGLGITAGLLNRFLLEKNFELPIITSEDERFYAQSMLISQNSDSKKTTKYAPHYLVGLDFEYEVYPGLYIFITPTISKSIRPIIDAEQVDTYAQEKMLNMGVRYQL